MAPTKDKQKILGESFTDDRIKSFLDYAPPTGVNPDYHVLEKAYRGMIADNFATFVRFFTAAGRDINALGPNGKTLASIIGQHRMAEDYVTALKNSEGGKTI